MPLVRGIVIARRLPQGGVCLYVRVLLDKRDMSS